MTEHKVVLDGYLDGIHGKSVFLDGFYLGFIDEKSVRDPEGKLIGIIKDGRVQTAQGTFDPVDYLIKNIVPVTQQDNHISSSAGILA